MRVNGLISAQRARLAPGWSACGPRIVLVRAEPPGPRIAPTLPPQQRGDAACLTLVMAQTFGAGAARGGGYASPPEDDAPLFVRRA